MILHIAPVHLSSTILFGLHMYKGKEKLKSNLVKTKNYNISRHKSEQNPIKSIYIVTKISTIHVFSKNTVHC